MKKEITLEEIYEPIQTHLTAVHGTIFEILSTPNELVQEVIRYFFSMHGKLLRPALTCLGAEIKGMPPSQDKRLLALAAAFEVFHAAT